MKKEKEIVVVQKEREKVEVVLFCKQN